MMAKRIVSYDFSVESVVAVDAPHGTDPDTLIDKALDKLAQQALKRELDLHCENTFDSETGSYEKVPEEWYKGRKADPNRVSVNGIRMRDCAALHHDD